MTAIGVLVIGGIGYGFFGAAPNLSQSEHHKTAKSSEDCLVCHERSTEKAPIMPHRSNEYCGFCHRPQKT